jgi:hypothetical protein
MRRVAVLLLIVILHIPTKGICQANNLIPTKEFKLKKTDYKIKLPIHFKLESRGGSDFKGYSIYSKSRGLINEFRIWIYLGYYPKSMAESSEYTFTENRSINILNDTVTFKVYKSSEDYLIEGFTFDEKHEIQTQVFFDKPLKLFFWGKAKDYNDINAVIRILETLKSTK